MTSPYRASSPSGVIHHWHPGYPPYPRGAEGTVQVLDLRQQVRDAGLSLVSVRRGHSPSFPYGTTTCPVATDSSTASDTLSAISPSSAPVAEARFSRTAAAKARACAP